jgi:hypothetical protein
MVFFGTPVFSTNKTDCHDITEILLKGAINTINHLPELNGYICKKTSIFAFSIS